MGKTSKIVISASRRTDIPCFYMDWFMDQIGRGHFPVVNPYNRRVSIVSASPEAVHSIVFWSKNYAPFITGGYGRMLQKLGYGLFFHFTVNSDATLLEPRVPPLQKRLRQLKRLCDLFPPAAITWRFDPICFYQIEAGLVRDNLGDFRRIADAAAACGVKRCVASFMDDYPKIRKRVAKRTGFSFCTPPVERQLEILQDMEAQLAARDICLQTCCEKELIQRLPADSKIKAGSCISHDLLMELYGGGLSLQRDSGQRRTQGCGCGVAKDIGSYSQHPCFNGCFFCYANPAPGKPVLQGWDGLP
jgi:hypothetical protein